MKLSQPEIELFFKLWYAMIWGINDKRKIVPAFKRPVYGERVSQEPFIAIRKELWENKPWIDEFLRDDRRAGLSEYERGIIASWRDNFIKDRFIVLKHTAKYAVFMPAGDTGTLYGVCGISEPIRETAPYDVPFMADAVLLPFMGRIIYDSLLEAHNVAFGPGVKGELNALYKEAMEKTGIIERIGEPPVQVKPRVPVKPPVPAEPPDGVKIAGVPTAMSARYLEISGIIEDFYDERINDKKPRKDLINLYEEYKEICLRALKKLCRKRPSPLVAGKARTWACGIVYAIGANNFIFDKSQPVNMTSGEMAGWFGLSKSTAGAKAAEVGKLLGLSHFKADFLLKMNIDDNPAIWLLSVNGILTDIRDMPREAQEEAFRKGYIPYIPADTEG